MNPFKLVIAGYYGAGNLGDDALLWGLLSHLSDQEFDVTVLSGNPEFTSATFQVPAIPRKNLSQIKHAIKNSDALVFAGGSLFQDVTSVRSVAYYAQLIHIAKSYKKKVILLGQGIGPLNTWLGKKITVRALNKADAIVLRDLESLERIKEFYIDTPAGLAADLAYLIEPKPYHLEEPKDPSIEEEAMKTKIVGLAPRFLKRNNNQKLITFFAELADQLSEQGFKPQFISMQPSEEMFFIRQIEALCKHKLDPAPELKTVQELLTKFAQLDSIIAMRLHAGIISTLFNIQPYMISYDPKVNAFSKSFGLPCAEIQNIDAQTTLNYFLKFFADQSKNEVDFEKRKNQLLLQAKNNISILIKNL